MPSARNAATNGYKSDKYIASTFREEVLYRSGNITPNKRTPIGTVSLHQSLVVILKIIQTNGAVHRTRHLAPNRSTGDAGAVQCFYGGGNDLHDERPEILTGGGAAD